MGCYPQVVHRRSMRFNVRKWGTSQLSCLLPSSTARARICKTAISNCCPGTCGPYFQWMRSSPTQAIRLNPWFEAMSQPTCTLVSFFWWSNCIIPCIGQQQQSSSPGLRRSCDNANLVAASDCMRSFIRCREPTNFGRCQQAATTNTLSPLGQRVCRARRDADRRWPPCAPSHHFGNEGGELPPPRKRGLPRLRERQAQQLNRNTSFPASTGQDNWH